MSVLAAMIQISAIDDVHDDDEWLQVVCVYECVCMSKNIHRHSNARTQRTHS